MEIKNSGKSTEKADSMKYNDTTAIVNVKREMDKLMIENLISFKFFFSNLVSDFYNSEVDESKAPTFQIHFITS